MKAANQPSLPYAGFAEPHTEPDLVPTTFENVDWSFVDSTARELTHGLHPWPAKFIPDIPRAAISLFSEPGDLVIDPFCGSGTVAVEAAMSGRRFIVGDLNPLAVRIAEAKCEVPTSTQAMEIIQWAKSLKTVRSADYLSHVPDIPNRAYWFSDEVAIQLSYLLAELRSLGHSTAFLEIVFSSIIVHASYQDSETRYRRVDKDVRPELVLALFRSRLDAAIAAAETIRPLVDAEDRSGRSYLVHDAREPFPGVEPGSGALAVFSPPYPNAFDYHLYHRFRMFWLGFDPRVIKHDEIGAHLRYQPDGSDWLADMVAFFANLRAVMRPGGVVLCVVGDGLAKGELIRSGQMLWDSVPDLGFRRMHRVARDVPASRKIFNQAFSRLRHEDVLVFST